MARIIANLKKNTVVCGNCLSIAERNPCHICADTNRDESQICVVEGSKDIIIIENTGKFKGKYHVLGGLINTIEGVKPENLNIGQLASKSARGIEEIILALPPTIEGETTSKYIQSILKKNNMKITKLARGLPMGSNLEYTDSITMMNAFDNRN
jgi:recombination protein RecR